MQLSIILAFFILKYLLNIFMCTTFVGAELRTLIENIQSYTTLKFQEELFHFVLFF